MDFEDKNLAGDDITDEQGREWIRRKYEKAQAIADKWKRMLDEMEGAGQFVGMPIKEAVEELLKERGKPMLYKEIEELVIKGGATMGKRDPEKQVWNSIDSSLRAKKRFKRKPDIGKLRDDDLIALPDMEFPEV